MKIRNRKRYKVNTAPILKKGNLLLRQAIENDIPLRQGYNITDEYAKMIGIEQKKVGMMNNSDAKIWYERMKNHPCKWTIEYEDRFIGVVSLRPYFGDSKAKFAIEIYDNNCYGKGIGTQVTKLVLEYAFKTVKYHKVFLRVLDYNDRAIQCYKKCGFIQEGIDREGAFINGEFHSDIYMGILITEYEASNL